MWITYPGPPPKISSSDSHRELIFFTNLGYISSLEIWSFTGPESTFFDFCFNKVLKKCFQKNSFFCILNHKKLAKIESKASMQQPKWFIIVKWKSNLLKLLFHVQLQSCLELWFYFFWFLIILGNAAKFGNPSVLFMSYYKKC